MMPKDLSIIQEANEFTENKSTTINPEYAKQQLAYMEGQNFSQLEMNFDA